MKELHLVHTIRNKKGENLGILRDAPDQTWVRQPDGDYLVTVRGDTENEYLVPAAQVKFERRPKTQATKK